MSGVEATEQYALRWGNHNNFLTQRLYEQCRVRSNTDVTIAVDGDCEFPAHKLVLSSCSEFFREHFEKSPCANPRVVIPGVSSELFSLILRYMYLGEINCPKTHLEELILVSRHLKIKGLQENDPSQADSSDFVVRPIQPIKSNGAFNQHRCDEDDMEGRFKKIVVSPFADALEQSHPQQQTTHHQQALERRPAPPPPAQHVTHNNNTSGKWEGKQSGRNGRKGYQPKKLPRAPINDIAEELRQRSLSVSPRPLVIADPGATVPVNGSHHSGEHSPPQNSLSSGGTAESSYSAAESAAAAAAASASAVASMSTSLPVDLSSPQRAPSSDAAAAIAAARANGNSTSPLAMDAIQNYFKMTGHQMKSGGSGLFENLASKTLEQYLANNIHNGSPSMLSLSDTLGMDPNSLPEHLRKLFNASSSLAASYAGLNQTPAAATSETAGSPSPTGAEGLLLAAAHLGPLGTESPLGEMDGGDKPKKGGKKPRRSAVNIVYGPDGQPMIGATGKPMVKCEICGKELADPSSLYRHRKIHNGEKPHKCLYCERRFIQRYNMVQHMKVHEKKMRRQQAMDLQAKEAELQSELLQMHAEPAYASS